MQKKLIKTKNKLVKVFYAAMFAIFTAMSTIMMASATTSATTTGASGAGGGGFGGGTPAAPTQNSERTFLDLIAMFATWFGYLGLVVGFIGAITFGLAIKKDDADQKEGGLKTMIAGFVVFAVTQSLGLFGLGG